MSNKEGFTLVGATKKIDSTLSLKDQAKEANKGQPDIEYKTLATGEKALVDSIPIGAILPHWGPWNFSSNWQICLGQKINDAASPLDGQRVPDLNGAHHPNSTTYIAGTLDTKTFRKFYGSNTIPTSRPW